jgi:hypothetical protein
MNKGMNNEGEVLQHKSYHSQLNFNGIFILVIHNKWKRNLKIKSRQ